MHKNNNMNRRSFLYSKIAFAAVGVSGVSHALEPAQKFGAQGFSGIENQASWKTSTADQFAGFVGQPFTAFAEDGRMLHLKLASAEAGNSGPARPKHLARSESVSLIFKSDFSDELAQKGDQTVWMWHPTLGKFHLMLGTTPRRSGGHDIEVVLN